MYNFLAMFHWCLFFVFVSMSVWTTDPVEATNLMVWAVVSLLMAKFSEDWHKEEKNEKDT